MNQPPNDQNSGANNPPGYGSPHPSQPQGYGQPGTAPSSGGYPPPPQNFRGATRQIFNPQAYKRPGTAAWGAASLIIALVSLILFCGLLSPFSLIFGLIGMFGKKRAKGAAVAGVILSVLQMGAWVGVFALGLWSVGNYESAATQGGAPVVAAIIEFKNDNDRVPYNLEELVDQGYLPAMWNEGLDDLDDNIRSAVEDKVWKDFLAYKPGADADWTGTPGEVKASGTRFDFKDMTLEYQGESDIPTKHTTYGLTFIGADSQWGTPDDTAVNQSPEKPYALTDLWGGNDKTREIAKKRRELQRKERQLQAKRQELESAVTKAEEDLGSREDELRYLIQERNLEGIDAVRSDIKGAGLLKLIGVTQKRLKLAERKSTNVRNTLDLIEIQIALLQNEEEMAKLADSPQEIAELETLLADSEDVLKTGGDLGELDELDEDREAEEWYNSNIGN